MPIPETPPYTNAAQPVHLSTGGPLPIIAQIRPPFLLAASPDRYEVIDLDGEPLLVPILNQHALAPGLHAMSAQPGQPFDPGADSDAFCAKLRRRGEHILSPNDPIPRELLPTHSPPGGYLRATPVRPRNTAAPAQSHHHTPWEHIGAPSARGESAIGFDHARFNAWRAHLVKTGAVPPPSEALMERLAHTAAHKIERLRQTPYPDPSLKAERVEAARASADRINAAIANERD